MANKPLRKGGLSFRDKYLALTIISLFSFLCSRAQIFDLTLSKSYGYEIQRIDATKVIFFPVGCGTPATLSTADLAKKKPALYLDSCNNRFWVFNPNRAVWDSIHIGPAGAGGLTRSQVDAAIDSALSANSIDILNPLHPDSLFQKMSAKVFRIKAVTGGYGTLMNRNDSVNTISIDTAAIATRARVTSQITDTSAVLRALIAAIGPGVDTLWTDTHNANYHALKKVKTFEVQVPAVAGTCTENGMQQSTTLSVSPWAASNVTVTDGAAVSLDGTSNLSELNSTFAGSNVVFQDKTVVPGAVYNLSFDALRKASGGITDAKYQIEDRDHFTNIIAPTSYYSSTSLTVSRITSSSFTVPSGCTTIRIYAFSPVALTGSIYVGRVQLNVNACDYVTTTTIAAPYTAVGGTPLKNVLYTDGSGDIYAPSLPLASAGANKYLGVYDSATGKLSKDSLLVLTNKVTFNTPVIVGGTSHFAGTIPGSYYSPVAIAGRMLGFTVTNQALGGTSLAYILETTYRNHQQWRSDSAMIKESGWNDANAGANIYTPLRYYNTFKAAIVNQLLDTAIAASSSAFIKTSGWSTYNTYTNFYGKAFFLGGSGMLSSTVGDSIRWTTPVSKSVVVQFGADQSTFGKVTSTIDGILRDTVDLSSQTTNVSSAFDPFAVTKVPVVKVYDNLANTTHTVVLKNISGSVIFDYGGTLRPNWQDMKPFLLCATLRTKAESWGNVNILGGNSLVEEMNNMGRKLVAEFKALNQNYPVGFIDVNNGVEYNRHFSPDNTHLNALGTMQQAIDIVNYITKPISRYGAIDQAAGNIVYEHGYPTFAGTNYDAPTAPGQDNKGTFRVGGVIHFRGGWNGNTSLGPDAGNGNSTGGNLVAIGGGAMNNGLVTGSNITSTGVQSTYNNTSGGANTANGFQALYSNTTGSNLEAFGYRSLFSSLDGDNNISVGHQGFLNLAHGSGNVEVGNNGFYPNEGSNNTGLGHAHGYTCATCNSVTLIGKSADVGVGNITNATALGAGAIVSASNSANIGNGQNVGIDRPIPTEKLDVAGNVRFSGALMPNNLPGAAGQVLTSAGAGAAPTWGTGPIVRTSADFTGRTTNTTVVTYTNGAADASYSVTAALLVTASLGNVTVTCRYTTIDNNVVDVTFYNQGSTTAGLSASLFPSSFPPLAEIRVKASTTISILATQSAASTFHVSGTITQLR